MELILSESTNTIDYVYLSDSGLTAGATVGLEDSTGYLAATICPGPLCATVATSGGRVRFTPTP